MIKLLFFLIPLSLNAGIKQDWGLSYDDFINKAFFDFKGRYEGAKNNFRLEVVNGVRVFRSEDLELAISYKEISPREGLLFIKNITAISEYFVHFKASKQELDPSRIMSFLFPKPLSGETIRYNFNHYFEINWRNEPGDKFISFGNQKVLARVRFEKTEDFERLSSDLFILDQMKIDFKGEILMEISQTMPIQQTYFRKYLNVESQTGMAYQEFSFLEYMGYYNMLVLSSLDGFMAAAGPLSIASDEQEAVSITLGN